MKILINLIAWWKEQQYKRKFEKVWGKGSYPPERIIVSQEAYDALIEAINKPPDPEVQERIRNLMNRKAPWD